jgi:hypothetical protein
MRNKKNISVRLSEADVRRLKEISNRLSIKDSDLFRYSVKLTLSKFMPLLRHDLKGIEILLAMLDAGEDLMRYFEFDTYQIDNIVNKDIAAECRISMEDVELVAIAALNKNYLAGQLKNLNCCLQQDEDPMNALRKYLQQKYSCVDEEEVA